ncbi:hypothetical protein [Halobellus rarus]|uniref:Uncharacterized protein n=1 Tax=Halobellus rarus TaxID=1126237 RepID=A0ABD6CT54_9EURY|nr:hypothetical protein [Halobellus rarus]
MEHNQYTAPKTLTPTAGYLVVRFRRAAGLAAGYGLLTIALLAVVNAVRIVTLTLLGSHAYPIAVFFAIVNLGIGLLIGTGGYVVLQRARRHGAGYGVDLDWGRVLGP